jgi:general secretion pathway protein H
MRRGYTLIEVVLVLVVLAVAAGVIAPSIGRSVESLRFRAEVAGIGSFLRSAREQAITQNIPYQVAVDLDNRVLLMRAVRSESEQGRGRILATKQLSPQLLITPDPLEARTVNFLPQGLSTGGRFRIESPRLASYLVTIDALTGQVSVRRSDP